MGIKSLQKVHKCCTFQSKVLQKFDSFTMFKVCSQTILLAGIYVLVSFKILETFPAEGAIYMHTVWRYFLKMNFFVRSPLLW